MSRFYSRNIVWVVFFTIVSIDCVAMQAEFLNSLHLISNDSRNGFMGWLGGGVLIAICIYPVVYFLLFLFHLIPARLAPIFEAVPFFAFGLWLAFIAYLVALTEFETVSIRLSPGLSDDKEMALWNEAQAQGIPITIVTTSNGKIAWINAKYASKGRALCRDYIVNQ